MKKFFAVLLAVLSLGLLAVGFAGCGGGGGLLGAAGGVEFVTCVKSIQDGFIHQSFGSVESEEECDLNYAIGAPVEKPVEYAMSNSLGFGGHNASLLIRKYEE